jgi:tetratricopeptide (TPR) repeat protein
MRAVWLTAAICAAVLGLSTVAARRRATAAAQRDERERARTPVAVLAPAPLPTGLPLVGPEGTDDDGYPRRYVDRAALRSLLWHGRYAELSRDFEELQAAFERDPRNEYWPIDAGEAFRSSERELQAALDAWGTADSQSFAPFLARGSYWTDVAYNQRGGRPGADTPAETFAAMREAAGRAIADLERALTLRPRLVAARRYQIQAFKALSDGAGMETALENAVSVCPGCYQVRVTFIMSLEPRWGGSYADMDAFARDSLAAPNPRMRRLGGFVDLDRAEAFERAKKYDQALAAIDRACALGDQWEFLLERADLEAQREDLTAARADVERAAVARPGEPSILFKRAWLHQRARRWDAAGADLLAGLRIDPTDSSARKLFDYVIRGLIYEGWQQYSAGRRDDALRIYDLAAELAPDNREVTGQRAVVIAGREPPSAADVAALERAARAQPDDFRAHQQLDYALARQNRYDDVIKMWGEYLARHPDDARAYLERGGAHHRRRDTVRAHADAQKACDLGLSEGCAHARR